MALIPPQFLDAVVAIGVGDDPDKRKWIGSGFLYARAEKALENNKKTYTMYLVSNNHVLKGHKRIYIKFNSSTDLTSKDYVIDLIAKNGKQKWVSHGEADVGAMWINVNELRNEERKFSYFHSDDHSANVQKLNDIGVSEGDGVYVLGFPMGMVDTTRQYVVCRSGCISRIQDVLEGKPNGFLIDATVFPGNSGGPVLIRPEQSSIKGTKAIMQSYLIGIVESYVPYNDVAISQQTLRPRIIFEENSGLTSVITIDRVNETVERERMRIKARISKATRKTSKK